MKNIFNLNSRLMQGLAMLTNLVALNILWLLCCIPVFTAGAATTALYHTIFQFHTQQDDAVLRPFFRAFRANFKQATLLWLAVLIPVCLVAFDLVYLVSWGQGTAVLFLLVLCAVFVLGMQIHLFPLIARFEMTVGALIRTAASLVMLHLPTTLLVLALNLMPLGIYAYDPMLFLRVGILWIGVWFSLVAFFNGKLLLKIWKKHMPVEDEAPEEQAGEE